MKKIEWERPKFPLEVSILITDICNFNCKHCFVKGRNIDKNLSLKTIKSVVDEMERRDVYNLNISGGEPFLHPDIFEILEYAEKKNMNIHLNTNFTVLNKEKIKKLSNFKLSHVDISIHGFSDDGLSRFSGVKSGVWSKLKKNIKYGLKSGIPLAFTTTLTKLNYNDTFYFLKFFAKNKLKSFFMVGLFHPSGQGLSNFNELYLENDLHNSLIKKITAFAADNNIELLIQKRCSSVDFKDNKIEIKESRFIKNYGCPCGEYSCFIWPDGKVTFCPYGYDDVFVMGNINNQNIDSIWNSDSLAWKKTRANKLKKITKCPYFKFCLGGCPSDTYHLLGDVNKCDPLCVFKRKNT